MFLGGIVVGLAVGYLVLARMGIGPTWDRNEGREEGPAGQAESAGRPWAEPLAAPGLANFYRVSDELYRGQQPDDEGFEQLARMGIRTVVNLRSFHGESDRVERAGLAYEHIYMKAWHPEEKDLVRFLRIVTDPARTPVFVHCQHGSDRTGTMCAAYRVVVCGWSKQEALAEMTQGGFGFHEMWGNLEEYIAGLDVPALRRQVGLPPQPPANVPSPDPSADRPPQNRPDHPRGHRGHREETRTANAREWTRMGIGNKR